MFQVTENLKFFMNVLSLIRYSSLQVILNRNATALQFKIVSRSLFH